MPASRTRAGFLVWSPARSTESVSPSPMKVTLPFHQEQVSSLPGAPHEALKAGGTSSGLRASAEAEPHGMSTHTSRARQKRRIRGLSNTTPPFLVARRVGLRLALGL